MDNETPWFKRIIHGEKQNKKGHLTATLGAGFTIGNAIFHGEMQKCPCTCTCATEQRIIKDSPDSPEDKTKGGWKALHGKFHEESKNMNLILVSRRNFLMARSAEPMRFIKTLPYFNKGLTDQQFLMVNAFGCIDEVWSR